MDEANTLQYAFQFGNESGSNAEVDKFKAVRFAARYVTNPGFTVEGYFSQFARADDADWMTAQVFAGYRVRKARVGFQYSYQDRPAASNSTASDVTQELTSVFAVFDPKPQKFSAFLRLDFYNDPCSLCSEIDYLPLDVNAKFTYVLAGIEYYIHPSVRFSPNVEWVTYGSPAKAGVATPKDDVVMRATFFWTW
jgi:hypothetical protein